MVVAGGANAINRCVTSAPKFDYQITDFHRAISEPRQQFESSGQFVSVMTLGQPLTAIVGDGTIASGEKGKLIIYKAA